MLQSIYEGNHKWHLRFDSGTEVILDISEIREIIEAEDHLFHEDEKGYIPDEDEQKFMDALKTKEQ